MLTSIRIQNFRSIRDAQVKLGQVNLFIGPNNSGKSNFLKGIELLHDLVVSPPDSVHVSPLLFARLVHKPANQGHAKENNKIAFDFKQAVRTDDIEYDVSASFFEQAVKNKVTVRASKYLQLIRGPIRVGFNAGDTLPSMPDDVRSYWKSTKIYKLEPSKLLASAFISSEDSLSPDASNLVPFLFNLGQNYKKEFRNLEINLRECVGSITEISTPPDPNRSEQGKIRLKFFDQNNNDYWAEEVSEGVLYFLALLCIIHQPDPPKLLLLEEPEKGIHPRRIREVMDFIFELARLRDIQIILTSHSPYVVDHFADIPECISVFDRENEETVIRNAADIIEETNAKLKEPIRYSDALGEHWVSGFLGGVPL